MASVKPLTCASLKIEKKSVNCIFLGALLVAHVQLVPKMDSKNGSDCVYARFAGWKCQVVHNAVPWLVSNFSWTD